MTRGSVPAGRSSAHASSRKYRPGPWIACPVCGVRRVRFADRPALLRLSCEGRYSRPNARPRRALTVVLIDGYSLSTASHNRGIGTFLKQLLKGLGDQPGLTVKVLAQSRADPSGTGHAAPCATPVRSVCAGLPMTSYSRERSADHGAMFFHSPAQHPPRSSLVPWIQTLHDLTPLTWPHPLLSPERRRWVRIGPRLRQAAAVATVSRFSADQAIRHFDLDPGRLHVIPLGVDPVVFRPRGTMDEDSPYLLHVAAGARTRALRKRWP